MFWISHPSPLVQTALAILYVLVAATVTADVLLKKSDVRGALGWIGAAWFSPILGGVLYYLFGINRVNRRALKLKRRLKDTKNRRPLSAEIPGLPPHIAELMDISGRVTGDPLTAGNALDILENGDGAYPQMLAAIAGAKQSIAFASYIFRNDATGHDFIDALIAAHKRGVQVRVLLDGVGTGYFINPIILRLREGGVVTRRFLHTWLPWRMPFLNMRNHRKLLVVDGATAFTGGINIGGENLKKARLDRRVLDVHFCVQGPVVRLVMDAFARDWVFTTGENLDEDFWWPELAPVGPVYARGLRTGPDADLYKLDMILGAALTLAKKRIRILTPYFLPDARLQFAIAQAALRGVEVEIVLPGRNDHHYMEWAMRAHLRFFNYIAAKVYVTPQPFDHAKLCTVDDGWCVIGSSNWDARSFRLNFEFDLECYDPALAKKLDAIIDARIARGKKLDVKALTGQPVWIRLRDAACRLLMPYL